MLKRFLIAAFLLIPASALADPKITMNGVDITGTTDQKFTNVTIEFDASGNLVITAPQYRIMNNDKTPAMPNSAAKSNSVQNKPEAPAISVQKENILPDITRKTWLIAKFNYPGLLGYNVHVYINNTLAKTLDQGQKDAFFDASPYLKSGTNVVEYKLEMAADSGTASKAAVEIFFAKQCRMDDISVEVEGRYAPVLIKRADGKTSYSVELIAP